jgi:transcriptional regulator with XRE-family HTH domain
MPSREYRSALARLRKSLRARRTELGLTQEAVAELLGMVTRHYQKIESGQFNVTLETLVRVAKALDMKVKDLF